MSSINLKKISPKKLSQKISASGGQWYGFGTVFASAPPAPPRSAQRKGAAPNNKRDPHGVITYILTSTLGVSIPALALVLVLVLVALVADVPSCLHS